MGYGGSAVKEALMNKIIEKREPTANNVGVKNRLDAVGALLNDLKAQWNTVNAGDKITADDYPKTFTEV